MAIGAVPAAELLEDLEKLDDKIAHIAVPLSYAEELYNMRLHSSLVRRRLRRARDALA